MRLKVQNMPVASRVRILFDEAAIARRNEEMAREIAAAEPKDLLVVAILKGSFMFAADLARAIDLPLRLEFLGVRSYGDDTRSSGVQSRYC